MSVEPIWLSVVYMAPEKRPDTHCILCGHGSCLPSEGSVRFNVLDHRQWMHEECITKAAKEIDDDVRDL